MNISTLKLPTEVEEEAHTYLRVIQCSIGDRKPAHDIISKYDH